MKVRKISGILVMIMCLCPQFLCYAGEMTDDVLEVSSGIKTRVEEGISVLHDFMSEERGEVTFPYAIMDSCMEDLQVISELITEYLRQTYPDELFTRADYILEYENRATVWWAQTEENYAIGCVLEDKGNQSELKLTIQKYSEYKADVTELPFSLAYGNSEEEIRGQLEQLPMVFDVISLINGEERGCFTFFVPEDDSVEYIQLYTDSFDSLQYMAQYAEIGFSFPLSKQLGEVVYYLSTECDIEDDIKPLMDGKWSSVGTSVSSNLTSLIYEQRDTFEVMKDSALLDSQFWKEYGAIYREYGSVSLIIDSSSGISKIKHDERRGLLLNIINTWTLKETS